MFRYDVIFRHFAGGTKVDIGLALQKVFGDNVFDTIRESNTHKLKSECRRRRTEALTNLKTYRNTRVLKLRNKRDEACSMSA
jgi:hypothetical protein